jgi:hypothetical protein
MTQRRLNVAPAGELADADSFDPGGSPGDVLTKLAPPAPGQPPGYGWTARAPLPSVTTNVFVSQQFGSDTTGDGTENNPYATIVHAMATITDASGTKGYAIFVSAGVYAGAIAVRPFISMFGESVANTVIFGNLTLGAGWADPFVGQEAGFTGFFIFGTVTFDYVAAGTSFGATFFERCNIGKDVVLTGGTNDTAFYFCLISANFTQHGGTVEWFDTNGNVAPPKLLKVQATAGFQAQFLGWSGGWGGDVTLDQNASTHPCFMKLNGFSASKGTVTIIASAALSPTISSAYGDLPENCDISGAGAQVLSSQMRVQLPFTIAPNTAIAAASVTLISFPYIAAFFGATPIESVHMSAGLSTNWSGLLNSKNCVVSITFETIGGAPTCNVCIYNPGLAFNTADPLTINTSGYLP